MSCGCKGGENNEINSVKIEETNYIVRIFNFFIISLILVILTPFLMIGIVILVFNQTILNKTNKISDIIKVLLYFKDKIGKKKNSEDELEDFDNIEDLEIFGVEKINKNE